MLVIKINSPKSVYNKISRILGLIPTSELIDWEYEIVDNSVRKVFEILNNKIVLLNDIGIKKEDVTIWLYYEYEGQCNIEFSANDLLQLSKLNINLCISCWQ